MQKFSYLAGLFIAGPDLDPTLVAGMMGRAPNTSWRKGQRAGGVVQPEGCCAFSVQGVDGEAFADVAARFVETFSPAESTLAELQRGYEVTVKFGALINKQTMAAISWSMPPELNAFIARLGLEVRWSIMLNEGQ